MRFRRPHHQSHRINPRSGQPILLLLLTLMLALFLYANHNFATRSKRHVRTTADAASRPWLNGVRTPFPLLSKRRISKDTHVYRFGLGADGTSTTTLGIDVCSCLLVSPADNEKLVRPYTPISSRHEAGSFSLLVKRYPDGAMGAEFENLKRGDSMLFWQIPFNKKIQYPFRRPKTIVMLAAGTGITPMYQALLRMFGPDEETGAEETTTTRIVLLYGSRTREDAYLRKELEDLHRRWPDRLRLVYALSSSGEGGRRGETIHTEHDMIVHGRIDEAMIRDAAGGEQQLVATTNDDDRERLQVWICGPPSFYDDICGPRYETQVSGILKDMGLTSEQVIKF